MTELLTLIGALLAALSAFGVVRLRSLLPRMHALTKAATGGIVFSVLGAALALRSTSATTTLLLALGLQLATFPVGANLVAHAVHAAHRRDNDGEVTDDTAEDIA